MESIPGVAHNLVACGLSDPVLLCAAVLHDTVEDTDTTFEEIGELFGSEVESVVREVGSSSKIQEPCSSLSRI